MMLTTRTLYNQRSLMSLLRVMFVTVMLDCPFQLVWALIVSPVCRDHSVVLLNNSLIIEAIGKANGTCIGNSTAVTCDDTLPSQFQENACRQISGCYFFKYNQSAVCSTFSVYLNNKGLTLSSDCTDVEAEQWCIQNMKDLVTPHNLGNCSIACIRINPSIPLNQTTTPPTTPRPTVQSSTVPPTIRPTTLYPTTMYPTKVNDTTKTAAPTYHTSEPTAIKNTTVPTTRPTPQSTIPPTTHAPTSVTTHPTTLNPTLPLSTMEPTTQLPVNVSGPCWNETQAIFMTSELQVAVSTGLVNCHVKKNQTAVIGGTSSSTQVVICDFSLLAKAIQLACRYVDDASFYEYDQNLTCHDTTYVSCRKYGICIGHVCTTTEAMSIAQSLAEQDVLFYDSDLQGQCTSTSITPIRVSSLTSTPTTINTRPPITTAPTPTSNMTFQTTSNPKKLKIRKTDSAGNRYWSQRCHGSMILITSIVIALAVVYVDV